MSGQTSPAARRVEVSSALLAEPRVVLAHLSTMRGVNQELYPLLRMTVPDTFRGQSLFDAPVGQRLFRSWLLLVVV